MEELNEEIEKLQRELNQLNAGDYENKEEWYSTWWGILLFALSPYICFLFYTLGKKNWNKPKKFIMIILATLIVLVISIFISMAQEYMLKADTLYKVYLDTGL